MNIFEIPLYYISFKQSNEIEKHYKDHGFKNVNHFSAIDGRKMSVNKLLKDNIISIRVHDDLRLGRVEHSGMPTKGGIGCTLSHYELWNKCVDNDWPFIIIVEEDNRMLGQISADTHNRIKEIVSQPNGVFISVTPEMEGRYKNVVRFMGTHFCVLSKGACEKLIDKTFPIDAQTDWYMSHMATINDIMLGGFKVSEQHSDFGILKHIIRSTDIQDICVLCWVPRNPIFWLVLCITILSIIYLLLRKFSK